jgi:hypothetical protein
VGQSSGQATAQSIQTKNFGGAMQWSDGRLAPEQFGGRAGTPDFRPVVKRSEFVASGIS